MIHLPMVVRRPLRPVLPGRGPVARRDALIVAAIPAAVAVAWWWGEALTRAGRRLFLGAAPFHGSYDLRVSGAVVAPVALAAAVVLLGPAVFARLGWRAANVVAVLTTAAWAVALAAMDGLSAVAAPLTQPDEYLADVPRVSSLRDTLASYVADLPTYQTHVRGHPPGPLLLLAWLDGIGLGGPVPAAMLVIATGATAVAAVAVTVRAVAGAATARRALPFLVLLPAALWVATSLDALFLAAAAWSTAALALAARAGSRWPALAVAGGAGWGAALLLTYGVGPLGLLAVAVTVVPDRRRTGQVLALSAAGLAAVLGSAAALGFNWFAGAAATRVEWARGAGPGRPWLYFLVSNAVVAAVCVGPAVVAALTRPLGATARLVLPVLAALAVANVVGVFRGEVERIWLPYVPWVAVAAAGVPRPSVRPWLAVQAATAIAVQAVLLSRW
ncbi:MAG TPA: hypothetical protein VEZ46_02945 [Mycobacteriales bacterium]|nr:hypothetical protein [Mycobacteriales bacterium]